MNELIKPLSFASIMFIAYGFKKWGIMKTSDSSILAHLVLKLTLPMAVIHAFASLPKGTNYIMIVALGFLCAMLPLLGTYAVTSHKDKQQRVFFMLNIAGYNIGCFSLPMIQALFQEPAGAITCLFDIGNAIMMTGGSYVITSSLLHISQTKETKTDMIKKFIASIPFDVYMIALIWMIFQLPIPRSS